MSSQLETDLIALFTPANFTATKEDAATGWTGAIESLYDGKPGGSTITGGTASGDDLTLVSTSYGTKGSIILGSASAYDEVNDRLGLGTTEPTKKVDVVTTAANAINWEARVSNPYNQNATGYGAGLQLKNSTGSSGNEPNKWAGVAAVAGTGGYSAVTDMVFYTANSGAPTEKMRITGSGKVGVNVNPTYTFDISSAGWQAARIQSADDALVTLGSTIASSQNWTFGASSNTSGQGSNLFFIGTSTSTAGSVSQKLTITSAGLVGINTAPDAAVGLNTYCDIASGYAGKFHNDGNNINRHGLLVSAGKDDGADGTYYLYCQDGDGTAVGYIEHNAGAFRLVDTSDERSKKDIAPTRVRGIETLQGINPIEFRRVRQGADARLVACGLSAQNLQAVYPEAVSIGMDGMLGVAKDSLIPVLVQAVKEQQQQIEGLKQQVEHLLSSKVDK